MNKKIELIMKDGEQIFLENCEMFIEDEFIVIRNNYESITVFKKDVNWIHCVKKEVDKFTVGDKEFTKDIIKEY